MIRKECIGLVYSKKAKNGCHFTGTVNTDPENFALYKALELDVFEKDIPAHAEIVEEKPKKKKKGDTSESDQ